MNLSELNALFKSTATVLRGEPRKDSWGKLSIDTMVLLDDGTRNLRITTLSSLGNVMSYAIVYERMGPGSHAHLYEKNPARKNFFLDLRLEPRRGNATQQIIRQHESIDVSAVVEKMRAHYLAQGE